MDTQPTVESSPPNRLGRPLGAGRGWRRRLLLHHLPLAAASAVVLMLFMLLPPFTQGSGMGDIMSGTLPRAMDPVAPSDNTRPLDRQLTTATGYVATGLVGLTLLVGPANLLLRRRTPISSPLARDIGTWAVLFSAVHVVFGFQVHGNVASLSTFVNYFFSADRLPRLNSFGLGNWTGLVGLIIVAVLLSISNDRSLRDLKAKRWKRIQRLNYVLFALVGLHAFFYGALLRTTSPFTLVLLSTVILVLAGQAAGIWLYRRRQVRVG